MKAIILPIIGAVPVGIAAIAGGLAVLALYQRQRGPMNLLLIRDDLRSDRTLGTLTIAGVPHVFQTLELPISGTLKAIPAGVYRLGIHQRPNNPGDPEALHLLDVPGHTWILIHPGNDPSDTLGCILVGWQRVTGEVLNSKPAVAWLETDPAGPMVAIRAGREVSIEIRNPTTGRV